MPPQNSKGVKPVLSDTKAGVIIADFCAERRHEAKAWFLEMPPDRTLEACGNIAVALGDIEADKRDISGRVWLEPEVMVSASEHFRHARSRKSTAAQEPSPALGRQTFKKCQELPIFR